jgi:Na+-driven multidrug efflux pump
VVFGTLVPAILIVPAVIGFIFAGKYDGSMSFFIILATGWSIRQLTQLQSGALFGLGKIKYNAYTAMFSLIFNVIIYPIFILKWGIIGAAYASIPSGLVMLTVSFIYFKKAINKI